jgi:transcriptional regulator with GAF, ATPase, and Fis domain
VKAAGLLPGLCFAAAAWAADSSGVLHIRAGRAALEASKPAVARAEFQAAIGGSLAEEDRFAAWMGLGRAELWLGHYRAASQALGEARRLAASSEERRVAETAAARALKLSDVVRDNKRLRSELERRYRFDQLIGTSAPFRQVIELITKVCESRATVLLTGESGTGKELVARAVHFNSPRQDQPFVAINCAALPEGLLESELFGHAKGAFAGAVSSRMGRFKAADGGTVFLDEIGDMPAATQAKILRVLQERTFEPVGSTRSEQVDVRIIAATHKDLRQAVAEGNFREDLYYRLNVFPIVIPSLRERSDDIPLLAAHFLNQLANETGKRIVNFTPRAMALMTAYAWPGNIRELMNCIERAVIVSRGSTIDVSELPPYLFDLNGKPVQAKTIPADLDTELMRIEREYILGALNQTGGVQIKAA